MVKSFMKRLERKMEWVTGDLLRVSPKTSFGLAWVSGDRDKSDKTDPLYSTITPNEIVMFLGPHEEKEYFYLMSPRVGRVVGWRMDFTRAGNVEETGRVE